MDKQSCHNETNKIRIKAANDHVVMNSLALLGNSLFKLVSTSSQAQA